MDWNSVFAGRIVDGHVHMGDLSEETPLLAIAEATGIAAMGLASIQNPAAGSGLAEPLWLKARHPARFFVMAGLNHAARLSGGTVDAPDLVNQLEAFVACGCDGVKMLEGKPTSRQELNIPVTDPYYGPYWERVEELGLPILWHVNDPEEFWDPARTPSWAAERDWGYGPDDVTKEHLYAEVDRVLTDHPRLQIVFAHFYFLSADLPRAGRFLDQHPTVCFDLAPGIEMLYNTSRQPAAGREFFLRYADRIVFGTDLMSHLALPEARARAGIVRRWLESDDTFRVPPEADFLLGPAADGIIHGMSLPEDVLARIYGTNVTRLIGPAPAPLHVGNAIDLCERIATIAEAMSGRPRADTPAGQVAARLAGQRPPSAARVL